jgi:UDP-N-acetylmuramyl-tripeptide synthetase
VPIGKVLPLGGLAFTLMGGTPPLTVGGMKFTTAVFTNLTRDHLDFHGDMESYFAAKRLLFTADGGNDVEAAVLNADDPYARRLASELRCRLLRFGFDGRADVRPLEVRSGVDGSAIRLASPDGEIGLRTRLPGRPNVYNIMAAAGAALTLGIPVGIIAGAVEAVEGVPGRMERVGGDQPFSVIVDYAHTPDALENLLRTVGELPHRRIITVFGCGGDRDRTKRPLMGSIAARLSDCVIATSDNPRSEDPDVILKEIRTGLDSGPAPYRIVTDRREAIGLALAEAAPGDIVVVAGKGHENYQIIGDRSLPFDDREVAREWLRILRAAEPPAADAAGAAAGPPRDSDDGPGQGGAR